MKKNLHCPNCGAKNEVEVDLHGIGDGESYHEAEECCECDQPFVVVVRAQFQWGCGKVEWQDTCQHD